MNGVSIIIGIIRRRVVLLDLHRWDLNSYIYFPYYELKMGERKNRIYGP
jgi:hypothetical protein